MRTKRNRAIKRLAFASAIALACLVLNACGGGGGNSQETEPTAPPPAPPAAPVTWDQGTWDNNTWG